MTAAAPFMFHTLPAREQTERAQGEYMKLCRLDTDPRADFSTSTRLKYLNRYSDILANQHSIFPTAEVDPRMYICGNRVNLNLNTPHQFVASQAPVAGAGIVSWWNVLLQQRVSLIMMLTKELERGIPKADPYWPAGDAPGSEETFGPFRVLLERLESIPNVPEIVVRHLSVTSTLPGNAAPHKITQLQFRGWPDHGIPDSTTSFRAMMTYMESHPVSEAPIIVHCSAGIGRTGTLIGYYALRRLLERQLLHDKSVMEVVAAMKQSRRGMVQRLDQYIFMYQCLSEDVRAATESQSIVKGA